MLLCCITLSSSRENQRGAQEVAELNLPLAPTNLVSESAALTVGDVDLKGELKKVNKNLKQMIQLNKHANLIALGFYPFYFCVVALGFSYLLVVT